MQATEVSKALDRLSEWHLDRGRFRRNVRRWVSVIIAMVRSEISYLTALIFLDFDGVMHPNFSRGDDLFVHADRLAETIGDHAGLVGIVISSSWRFHYSWEEMLERIPVALHASVQGVTPEVQPGAQQRYREILLYLKAWRGALSWVAIDDDVHGFPMGLENLIACDGRIGFDDQCAVKLRRWLDSIVAV